MTTFTNQLDEVLKAVYGNGRNSRLKLSESKQLVKWMTEDQAKTAITALLLNELTKLLEQRFNLDDDYASPEAIPVVAVEHLINELKG